MKEIKIEYKVKAPANEEEAKLIITNIVGGCSVDGAEMRYLGASGCVHEDYYTYIYQCPTCKNVEITGYPFGHTSAGIDEPTSNWERV